MVTNQEKETVKKGICGFCGGVFEKRVMLRHLQTCEKREEALEYLNKESPKQKRILHLFVEGRYAPEYWMHLGIAETATLQTLDDFIRNIWVECCEHLSAFQIGGEQYLSHVESGSGERGMNKTLSVLKPGMKFYYEYDFGTPTELVFKVVSAWGGAWQNRSAVILAKNKMPDNRCVKCGKPAKYICSYCYYEGNAWFCEECAVKHKCGEGALLPAVNSPRTGVCGYGGY